MMGRKIILDEVTTQFYQIGSGRVIPLPAPGFNPISFGLFMLRQKMGMLPKDALPPMPQRSAGGNLVQTSDLIDPQTKQKVGTSHLMLYIMTDGRSKFVPSQNPPFFGDIQKTDDKPHNYGLASWYQVVRLNDGDIIINGLLDEAAFEKFESQTAAIVGGTGAYIGAKGQVKATQVIFPHTARLEIELMD